MSLFDFILYFLSILVLGILGILFIVGKYDINLDLDNVKKKKTTKKSSNRKK